MKNKRNILSLIICIILLCLVALVIFVGCDQKAKHVNHSFGEWKVDVAATCAQEGVESRTCKICGIIETAVINKKAHTEVIDEAVEPTCTEGGRTAGKHCSVCGAVIVACTQLDALGHDEVVDESVEATCAHVGLTEGRHCSRCGIVHVEQQEIPMIDHTIVHDEAVEPTCVNVGYTEGYHCSECGRIIVRQQVINALGHDFDENCHCSICDEDRDGFLFELVMFEQGHAVNEDNYCVLCGTADVLENFVFDSSNATYSFRYVGPRTRLTLPSRYRGIPVTTVGRSAFREAGSYLEYIDISDSITTISNLAFAGCYALRAITIGHNLTTIGDMAFMGCSALESIVAVEEHSKYHSAGNCLIETESKTLIAGCKTSVIPNDGSVEIIGSSAFNGNTVLSRLSIPEGVTTIGAEAFYACSKLTYVILPHSLESIGSHAFFQCEKLTDIYYDGTKAEWKEIQKGGVWDMFSGDYIIHCSDGDIEKSNVEESGSKEYYS